MKGSSSINPPPARCTGTRVQDGVKLSRTILRCANRGLLPIDFLRVVSRVLLDYSGCDAVEVRLSEGDLHYRWEASRRPQNAVRFELVRWMLNGTGRVIPALDDGSDLERLCQHVACQHFDANLPFFTANGSFWTGDAWEPLAVSGALPDDALAVHLRVGGVHRSLAIIRFFVSDQSIGLLHFKSERPGFFAREDVEFYEGVAQTLGLAVADRRAEAALRERVKELTCLYGLAQVVEHAALSLEEMLSQIVELLPPAWQYPEIAAARLVLDERCFATDGYRESRHRQSADVVVAGRVRGVVEVLYVEDRPEFAPGPFLSEEAELLAAVAREVGQLVERREAEAERAQLQGQLIHADRLATIGQLAAGVAHELNEPLASILGFAQLAQKHPDLPGQARQDLEKIVTASLYAREVIKKLMVFARQMPARREDVDLNRIVEEGLYLLEARCAKSGIRMQRDLATDLPRITADPAQLHQVLINLVVNAVQAMPNGGSLAVTTRDQADAVVLEVADTGVGMTAEVMEKAFLPFFTTKDINEGTGLGLAVVHGIVTGFGGSIKVESEPGHGARFQVRFPRAGAEQAPEARDHGNGGG